MKHSEFMKGVVLIGRILFSLIFIMASVGHFSHGTIAYAANHGVRFASILVPLSGLLAVAGGLSILLGFKAKWGAWLIVIFLIPATLMMHNFWTVSEPIAAMIQRAMFMKNLSMLGGALIIAYFGSGPYSLDKHKKA